MTPRRPDGCAAVQSSDEMRCGRCALVWDVNDPDPPACRRRSSDRTIGAAPALAAPYGSPSANPGGLRAPTPRGAFTVVPVALELPEDLAERMAAAYQAAEAATDWGSPRVAGMRAAWRVFLDEAGR